MPENQNNQELNKPDSTQENQNNQIAKELLEKLGLHATPTQPPNQPTAPNATTPTVSTETEAHPANVVLSHSAAVSETEAHAGNDGLSQVPPEVEVALAAVRGGVSVEVNVSSCPGVCGGRRRGLRLSPVEYLALVYLRDVLGYRSFCDVLRDEKWHGVFCGRRRGRVVSDGVVQVLKVVRLLKELSRVESREGPYAAGYLVKRLVDGVPYYEFVGYLKRKLMASVAGDLLRRVLDGGTVPSVSLGDLAGTADGLLAYFAAELGFGDLYGLAHYLQASLRVAEPRFTARHGGYRDVEGLVCSDGVVFSTTEPVLRVFWKLVWHLKHDHGLVSLDDVEGEAEARRDRVGFILSNMRNLELLMSWLADGIEARGLVKDGVCSICSGKVGSDPFAVVMHFVNCHREPAENLFKNLAGQQAQAQEPQALDLFEEAAREVAQRLGVDFELALGVVKTVHSIVNIEEVLSVDEIAMHLGWYDPELPTRLTGIDVRQLVLAVKEALDVRGLIDVRVKAKAEPTDGPPNQVKPDKQASMVQGNAQHQQSQASTQVHEAKGQLSLKAFMPQGESRQASKQVNSKPVEGGVDVSEILRPEVVLKPINDPEALRRAVREFFEPWIIEEPDPRWLRVKRKYTMKLVEAVDKAKSIEELNEMIARIEAEESQELAQLEKELKKQ